MAKAKSIIAKIERRGNEWLRWTAPMYNDLVLLLIVEIYRYIGNTHIKFSTDFDKVSDHNRHRAGCAVIRLFRTPAEMRAKKSLNIVDSMKV